MKAAPRPENEQARLQALADYQLLDTLPEEVYDSITALACQICWTPIAVISLVDGERVWLKSRQRIAENEGPRDLFFCSYAITEPEQMMVVQDTRLDERFEENPLVTGDSRIWFYAGVPLVDADGHALGTLCVMDHRPRTLSGNQLLSLNALAKWVMTNFELRRVTNELDALRQPALLPGRKP